MKMFLYNTMAREKQEFVPLTPGKVKLYSCGPTVYGDPHIGNMRAYLFVDILKSSLEVVGEYEVNHVMNITDVGHLTDDGDQGEDKMEKGARRERKTVWEVARMYEANFKKYADALQLSSPRLYTRATEYIVEQIAMVQSLIDQGYTYVIEHDGIYMDTSKVPNYGKLAQLDFAGMNSDHRGDGALIDSSKKKNLSDFALWKFSPRDEHRSMEWVFDGERSGALLVDEKNEETAFPEVLRSSLTESEEQTKGFPGWHIECSAMATKELGTAIDIHTGGIDHVTVHHTNEIAQAECSIGCDSWVNWWMHVQFLQIRGSKVSKSKGDDLSIPGIIAQGYDPLDLRYFYLTGHYRSFLDFTWDALDAAAKTRKNLTKKIATQLTHEDVSEFDSAEEGSLYAELCACMADDLDTVSLLSKIHTGVTGSREDAIDILLFDRAISKLGLYDGVVALMDKEIVQAPLEVQVLAQKRLEAKKAKNRGEADSLRDEITAHGWSVKDTADGFDLLAL